MKVKEGRGKGEEVRSVWEDRETTPCHTFGLEFMHKLSETFWGQAGRALFRLPC